MRDPLRCEPLPMRLLMVVLALVVAVAADTQSGLSARTTTIHNSNNSNNTSLPHCSQFQHHCVVNTTTASCTFHESIRFRCGAANELLDSAANNTTATSTSTSTSTSTNTNTTTAAPPTPIEWDCKWELTGDLVLATGVTVALDGDDCALQVSVGTMLLLQPQASLQSASVNVHASFVRLERNASIQAKLQGTRYRGASLLFPGDARVGASHGGSGGKRVLVNETTAPQQQQFGAFFDTRTPGPMAHRAASAWDLEALWGDAMAKTRRPTGAGQDDTHSDVRRHTAALLLLGSSSSSSPSPNSSATVAGGGGRIRVVASRDLVVMEGAALLANGDHASCADTMTTGGSGGSVFVSATALSLTDSSAVSARGGDACCATGSALQSVNDCMAGGGGGRVHIAYVSSQLDDEAVDVSGGRLAVTDGGDDDQRKRVQRLVHRAEQRALGGAAGTYLRVVHATKSASSSVSEAALVLANRRDKHDNSDGENGGGSIGGGAVTPVVVDRTHRRLGSLVIRNGAAVATHALFLPNGDLDLRNGSYLLDASFLSSSASSASSSLSSLLSLATGSGDPEPTTMAIDARNVLASGHARVLLPHYAALVRADAVSLDATVLLRFEQRVTLASVRNLHVEATITSSGDGDLVLLSGKDVYLGGSIHVGSLAVHANASLAVDAASLDAARPTSINARFQPCDPRQFRAFSSSSTSSSVTSAAFLDQFLAFASSSNFTMVLQSSQSIVIGASHASTGSNLSSSSWTARSSLSLLSLSRFPTVSLSASAVLLCAQNEIALDEGALVSSNGRGLQANQGPGSGDCVGSVGGGGGYGGRGADSSTVSDIGDYASGGLAYGTRGGIGMLGSGGGCVDGGAGGGVVMVGARGVVLDGEIHCNGDGGINSGGGGSGGFLGLTIAEYLKGNGRISAVGGGAQCLELSEATKQQQPMREPGENVPIVATNTTVSGMTVSDTTAKVSNTTTTVSLAANQAAAVAETAAAAAAITRVCGGGGGGGRLQLHGCGQNDVDKCTSGFEGNYTVAGGATSLADHAATPAATATTTPVDKNTDVVPVSPPSSSSPSSSVAVDVKPAASGSFVGFPCPPGFGGLFCRVCGPGFFKAESNSEECEACVNAPSNAHYVGVGAISEQCEWTCNPGYSGDQCVSPIQQLLDACGGFLGFAVVLCSIVGVLILLGYACRSRKDPEYTRNVHRGAGGRHHHTNIHTSGAASTKSERQHLLSAAIASTQKSRFAFLLRWLYWPRVGYPKLVERDLPEHMARIYFSGLNDRDAPLKLRLTVPPPLKSVLYEDEFRLLAERINAALAWPSGVFGSWGEMVYRLVVLLCLPGASAVLAYRRHLRLNALKRIIARYNHACMKGPRARGLLNALKIGYSGEYSLVYLELLYKESSQSACVPTTAIGKPSLPIVLLFAGRGTYESPFYLDPSDLLVRSIPQCPELTAFIDEPWIEFVAELNELLRVVSNKEVRLVETLLPVAQFLENKMASVAPGLAAAGTTAAGLSGGNTGTSTNKLGGLCIYLGRFYVGDDVDCGEEFKLGILLTTVSAESGGGGGGGCGGFGLESSSLALAPTSGGGGGRSGGYGTYANTTRALDSLDGYGRALPTEDAHLAYDHLSEGWSYAPAPPSSSSGANNSRAYMRRGSIGNGSGPPSHKSTVSSIREEALRIRSNTSGSVDNLFLTAGGGGRLSDFDTADLHTHPRSGRTIDAAGARGALGRAAHRPRRRRQTFYEGWLGPVDGSLPVPGVLISADELDDRLADRTPQQRLEAFVRRYCLPTNVPPSTWLSASWMVHTALLGLLMVDLAITFAMVVNLRCVTNGEVDTECSAAILMPVLLLPPLTLVLAPLMGVVSLAIASNSFSRRYAVWNALSMANVAVAMVVCVTQSRRLVAPWFTAPLPLLPAIAMVVKTGEAFVIERYIALQETNRRRRGWRGLMKRRLSDVSIPPESPYSSPVSSDNLPSYGLTTTTTAFR